LHMRSELDGEGGVEIDGKGKIVGPNFFGSLTLFSLQKGLIELEKEILLHNFDELILYDDVLTVGGALPNMRMQSDRYTTLQKWLGQTLEELFDKADIVANEILVADYPEKKEIINKAQKADCVVRLWDKYKSLSWEERTAVYYLFRNYDNCVLFPMALISGHCSVEEFAMGVLASYQLLTYMSDSSITEEQQKELYEELRSDARVSLDYIKFFRKGTPNKKINDLIEKGESQELEFKSTLRWDLVKDKKEDHITNACMKTIAAFMNTNGGKLIIGISDKGEYVGIDKDRLQNNDKFQLFLTNSIKVSIGIEALEYVNFSIYEIDQHKICIIECKKADELMYCKKKGEENVHAYIRTGPETIILQPNKFEEYKKKNFNR
ncbi:ATP-binding protein, partial [bacterium]|nr:ATP-binding protein [bacterium]